MRSSIQIKRRLCRQRRRSAQLAACRIDRFASSLLSAVGLKLSGHFCPPSLAAACCSRKPPRLGRARASRKSGRQLDMAPGRRLPAAKTPRAAGGGEGEGGLGASVERPLAGTGQGSLVGAAVETIARDRPASQASRERLTSRSGWRACGRPQSIAHASNAPARGRTIAHIWRQIFHSLARLFDKRNRQVN